MDYYHAGRIYQGNLFGDLSHHRLNVLLQVLKRLVCGQYAIVTTKSGASTLSLFYRWSTVCRWHLCGLTPLASSWCCHSWYRDIHASLHFTRSSTAEKVFTLCTLYIQSGWFFRLYHWCSSCLMGSADTCHTLIGTPRISLPGLVSPLDF